MGGWMDYDRFRRRNGLMWRKPLSDGDPYPRNGEVPPERVLPVGDLNRMERDYLQPVYPSHPLAQRPDGSSPAEVVAAATGVDVETVRKVLRCVFWGNATYNPSTDRSDAYVEWDGEDTNGRRLPRKAEQ